MKLHKKLFFLVVLLLPLNLGKHYVFVWSYVNSILTDYLVPTVYVTDILIGVLVVWWLVGAASKRLVSGRTLLGRAIPESPLQKKVLASKPVAYLIFFLFSVLLSVLSAHELYPAAYAFGHLFLYVLFFFYVLHTFEFSTDFVILAKLFMLSVFALSILGVFQWVKQGSVFDNYLFFGEQPYTVSVKGVVKDNFFGVARVPPYGTFRHPNVFGGFLSITLIWIAWVLLGRQLSLRWRIFGGGSLALGVVTLFLTLSKLSWVSFIVGVLGLSIRNTGLKKGLLVLMFGGFLSGFVLPFISTDNVSVTRRADLLNASVKMLNTNPLFGVGLNNNVIQMDRYLMSLGKSRFNQPVHNVFALVFSESGLFAAVALYGFLILIAFSKRVHTLFLVSLVQLVLLSSFDHYFYTINQGQLLLWLTLGIALSTILVNEKR